MRPGRVPPSESGCPPTPTLRCSVRVFGVGLVVAAGLAGAVSPAQAASGCSKVASPSGSDSAAGSESAPYRSAQKLADSLASGQTGCLRAGTYTDSAFSVVAPHTDNITLRSYPGERAKLSGQIEIANADGVTLSGLNIEGTGNYGSNTLRIYSANVVIENNDITNNWHGRSCLMLGNNSGGGQAVRPTIRRNRFHECGRPRQRRPRPRHLRRQHRRRRDHRQPVLQLRRFHHPALPQLPTHPLRPQRRRRRPPSRPRRSRHRRRQQIRLQQQHRREQRHRQRLRLQRHQLLGKPSRHRQHRPQQLRLERQKRQHHHPQRLHRHQQHHRQPPIRKPHHPQLHDPHQQPVRQARQGASAGVKRAGERRARHVRVRFRLRKYRSSRVFNRLAPDPRVSLRVRGGRLHNARFWSAAPATRSSRAGASPI